MFYLSSFFYSPVLLFFPLFFFFNDTATTEIYTLSLHDALPIFALGRAVHLARLGAGDVQQHQPERDRKSTRLNSSHSQISYAVFCLKKKKKKKKKQTKQKRKRRSSTKKK